MTDTPARPVRSAAARIAARYSPPVERPTRPLRPVTDAQVATTSLPVTDAQAPTSSLPVSDPRAATPAEPDDGRGAELVELSPRAVDVPVRGDHATAAEGPTAGPTAADRQDLGPSVALPRLVAGARLLHVLGLLGVGLLAVAALVLVAPVVADLTSASTSRAFAGSALMGAGAIALLGVARWLDHLLSDRIARHYAESLLHRVVERSVDHPAAVSRLGAHSVRAIRDATAHLHARLVPLAVVLVGAAVALTIVHRSLALVAAAPLIMLGAVAAATAASASRATRAERRARHELTTALGSALSPPDTYEVEPVASHVVVAGAEHEPDAGEDAVADTLDPDDDELAGARTRDPAARGGAAGAGDSAGAEADRPGDLPADVRTALGRLAEAQAGSAEALGTLRAVGLVVVGFALAAVAVAGHAAGVPVGELAGALVVTAIAATSALDVAEGARFVPATVDARRALGRALAHDE
ncbi:hypothetical protein [Georgenia sp. Z1491]|uniref:hypothetical protein n=1 Tax=Georgenia sp. Z1491 TaxID=3416707 RepID=UPI003CF0D2A0